MNSLRMFDMVILLMILLIRVVRLMVSKACVKFVATSAVLCGGLF